MRTLWPLTVPGWGHVCADAGPAAPAASTQAPATDARTPNRMPGFLTLCDEDCKVRPDVLGRRLESRLPEPRELFRDGAGQILDPVDLDHGVLRVLRDDDVTEHEGVRHLCDPPEQVALTLTVQMVDGETRDHEIKGPIGERILEPLHAQVGVRQPLARVRQHRVAPVDPGPAGAGVAREDAQRRLAGSRPELEDVLAPAGRRDSVLQLVVTGKLLDDLAVAIRIPRHAPTIALVE